MSYYDRVECPSAAAVLFDIKIVLLAFYNYFPNPSNNLNHTDPRSVSVRIYDYGYCYARHGGVLLKRER